MTEKPNKWVTIRENSAYPDYYASMTKDEQRRHERDLDRKVRNYQHFWKRCAYIFNDGPRLECDGVCRYYLYDDKRQQIGLALWTPDIAYSIADEYGIEPIAKEPVDTSERIR